MSTNGNGQFREDELVSRRVKTGNEWQTRVFPVVGGRLRILHENNDHLSIQTEIVRLDSDFVVVRAAVESQRGKFNGTGTASSQRDVTLLIRGRPQRPKRQMVLQRGMGICCNVAASVRLPPHR